MESKKRVLFVENFKIFEKWASKTYPFKCEKFKEDPRYDVYDFGSVLRHVEPTDYDVIVFGWHAVSINKYYTIKHDFYSKYVDMLEDEETVEEIMQPLVTCNEVIRYVMVQDLHDEDYKGGVNGLVNFIKTNNINGIITPYMETKNVRKLRSEIKRLNVIWMPHHIDENFFKDYKLEKKYDILLFGNDRPKYYPFRSRVITLLDKYGENYGIKVHKIPKPRNYFKYNPAVSNMSLSKIMSQSWLTLCTSSSLDYLLGKYFEASFSGSVVFGNMAADGKTLWESNYINIEPSMTDSEIIETLINSLKDKEKLNTMANNMQLKMKKEFKLSSFTHHLFEQL